MLVAALMVLLQAVPPVPTFSAQVQVVGVTVNAVDARTGKPVGGLTAADFQVLEDGKRQEMLHFEREEVPASVLILLDTSTSMRGLMPAVREAAIRLIRSLRPVDEVHVATFDDRYRLLCDFTTDHDEAVRALAELHDGNETALNWALYTATRMLERRHERDTERRRVLVLMSDGENTHDSLATEVVIDALRRSPVVCYVVHLQRQFIGDARDISRTQHAQQFMESIVYETGGRLVPVVYPYEEFVIRGAFHGIGDELGAQYHLVYASSSDGMRGGWRTIGVAMTSRADVRLRHRRGYYVPARR